MNDHLPECIALTVRMEYDDAFCICHEVRLCEARLLLSKPNIELSALYGYELGHTEALDAARDAVAAVPDFYSNIADLIDRPLALAAIDALKEKP